MGRFKARIRVLEMELKGAAMPPLDLKALFEQSVYITRLYVTRGIRTLPLPLPLPITLNPTLTLNPSPSPKP